jgi:hypothetical protein
MRFKVISVSHGNEYPGIVCSVESARRFGGSYCFHHHSATFQTTIIFNVQNAWIMLFTNTWLIYIQNNTASEGGGEKRENLVHQMICETSSINITQLMIKLFSLVDNILIKHEEFRWDSNFRNKIYNALSTAVSSETLLHFETKERMTRLFHWAAGLTHTEITR